MRPGNAVVVMNSGCNCICVTYVQHVISAV